MLGLYIRLRDETMFDDFIGFLFAFMFIRVRTSGEDK